MRVFSLIALIVVLMAALPAPTLPAAAAQAQGSVTTVGREFRFAFNGSKLLPNPADTWQEQRLYLYISSAVDTSGLVDFTDPALSDIPFTVTGGDTVTVELPRESGKPNPAAAPAGVSNRSIRVTAANNIALSASWWVEVQADALLIPPTSAGGTLFVVPSYASPSEFSWWGGNKAGFVIVAHENDTQITYVPRESAPFTAAGSLDQELYLSDAPDLAAPQTLSLDAGQVFIHEAESLEINGTAVEVDPSGSIIESDKPITVYGFSSCAFVPAEAAYCDYLIESVVPVPAWSSDYIAPPATGRLYQDTYRGYAWVDGTVVSLNGTVLTTLAAGEYFEYRQRENIPLVFSGSQPFMLMRYFNSSTNVDSDPGDPSMLTMIGTDAGLRRVRFTTANIDGFTHTHSVTIVRPRNAAVTMNGSPLGNWTQITGTNYDYTVISDLATGVHMVSSTDPLQVYASGLRPFESYAYPAGMNLTPKWLPVPLLNPPLTAGQDAAPQIACRNETDIAVSPQVIELDAGGAASVTITMRNIGTLPAGTHDVLLSLSDGLSVVGSSSNEVVNLGQRAALQNFVLQPNETRSLDVTVRAADSLPTAPLHITELYCAGRVVERIDGVFLGATVAAPVAEESAPVVEESAPVVQQPAPLPAALPNTAGSDALPWLLAATAAALSLLLIGRRLQRR